ncbi:TIGR01777 family oxidoreductase [Staphylococcus sp. IVB6238]|uniref:TIGR01777 family oxidoreductase n=1 Tax=Staphylococcus sp. IVB6238 TaxID=2989770 RepID=UPI0021D2AA36|nr:TIGR01777 family oxidoreductase [Staphylococcus sp. IVB6238]UXR74364.1 TIGR01777 family oxidoreductase [Staphylococcus sp. IVB6238]
MTTYLISGGTGLVGQHLTEHLLKSEENTIYILTRSTHDSNHPQLHYINWQEPEWQQQVPAIDVVINLAGATLNHYWTKTHKQLMMTSRIQTTYALFDLFKSREQVPRVIFNASAIGYYPPSNTAIYTETFQRQPHDFLSEIVYQWERQARQFEQLGTRVISGRFGIVLSGKGGALPVMTLPYRLWIGGKLSDGNQPYSWIHIDDLIHAILFLIHQENAKGAINLTAPYPVTQHHFGLNIQKVLHRPHYMRVPKWVLRLILGEMSTLILETQYVKPQRLLELGYQFKYPKLTEALEQLLIKK